MATRSRLLSGVRQYCNNLPDCPIAEGGLPSQTIYEVLIQIETSMLIDAGLSDQNRTVDSQTVNISQETFSLSASNVGAPAYVWAQVPDDDFWYPVDIVNHGSLLRAREQGRMAVAFYGEANDGEISWWPDGTTYRLRVWYDKTADEDPDLDDVPSVVSDHHTYMLLQAAAQCRELLGLPVGDVLMTRLMKGEKQWHKHTTMSRQQGTVKKPSFVSPRLSGNVGYGRRGAGGFRLP